MDEKHNTMVPPSLLSTTFSRRSRLFSIRRLILAVTLTCTIYYFHPAFLSLSWPILPAPAIHQHQEAMQQPSPHTLLEQTAPIKPYTGSSSNTGSKKISLEAHLMSKCPDARDCLHELVVPAMSEVSSLVDFKLFYIGTPSPTDDSVICKHGPSECLGNSISLCVQELYGNNSMIYLGFTNCLIRDYKKIPAKELVQDCALEHAVDFEKVNKCVSENGRGDELLRKSVLASKERGVKLSCTVRLEDDIWCVRDSGKWKQCGSHGPGVTTLVEEIQKRSASARKSE